MKRVESFAEARQRQARSLRFFKLLVIVFIVYQILTAYGIRPYIAKSSGMAPVIVPGDMLLTLPAAYGLANPLNGTRLPFREPQRGDIVLLHPPWVTPASWYRRLLDAVLRFFTIQRIGLAGDPLDRLVIKRIIAIPGDAVRMDAFVFYIRAAGTSHFLTEFEVAEKPYDLVKSGLPDGWSADMPLSGSMPEILLGQGQYFVAGDNRPGSADSRFFGAVDVDHILGRIVLRYWPWNRPLRF
jgi:signal peptidase I